MKKILSVFLILLLFTISVSAHSGGTDANGGHYNRSTGEYHYHHGYPAHQHVNGVCPYDNDDKTDHHSTSGSSGGKSSGSVTQKVAANSTPPDSLIPRYWWVSLILICLFLLKLYVNSHRDNQELRRENSELTQKSAKEVARFVYTQQTLQNLFNGKRLSELAPPPHPSDFVNSKGLPCGPGPGPWGTDYTVYLTSLKSPVFHGRQFCSTSYGHPVNITQVGNRRPCAKCCQSTPDLRWYYKQKQILTLCQEYGIDLSPEPSNQGNP